MEKHAVSNYKSRQYVVDELLSKRKELL